MQSLRSDAWPVQADCFPTLTFARPVLTAQTVERHFGVSRPAALSALRLLQSAGVIAAADSGPRGQFRWRADEILNALIDTPT